MNKICGYSCEHNKSGVCQISICDKKTYMSDKTEIKHLSQSYYDLHEKYYKLQQENKKLNGAIQTYDILLKANVEENKQLKDNWNKLRKWIVYNKHNENTEQHYLVVDYGTLLGKMQELERSNSNGNN